VNFLSITYAHKVGRDLLLMSFLSNRWTNQVIRTHTRVPAHQRNVQRDDVGEQELRFQETMTDNGIRSFPLNGISPMIDRSSTRSEKLARMEMIWISSSLLMKDLYRPANRKTSKGSVQTHPFRRASRIIPQMSLLRKHGSMTGRSLLRTHALTLVSFRQPNFTNL